MKTLENHTLLYDDDCPLCKVYTKGFINAEMLDENGKKPYCQLSIEERKFIDVKRASNEIALVDNENKTVLYGIDSLLKVIGFSFPCIEKVGNWKPVNYFLKKLYKLISFNRKVIVPSKENKEIELQCVPDFNVKYRCFYIALTLLLSSFINYNFLKITSFKAAFFECFMVEIIMILLNFILIFKYNFKFVLNWIGNFQTSFLIKSFSFLLSIILNFTFAFSEHILILIDLPVLLFVAYDLNRRFKIAKFNNK